MRQSDKTSEFWRHYTELTAGLLASPGPIIRFETIIEHIAALENESYRVLSEQRDLLAISFGVNLATDTNLRPVWLKWAQAHNALIDAYEAIKRAPRFGKLLRPARSSRWGDRIQIHLWARERGQIVTIETSEQTIDILFEPHPPYETSEISHGRGLSTVRIGLKAIGKTFANCKVYIEKIAPQPPLPGGLPIQLSGDAPMLRPDDPEALIDIASHWDHVEKYRFSAPLPPMDSSLWYIDDDPPRLIEIKIIARSDTGEFQKTALFRIQVDESKKAASTTPVTPNFIQRDGFLPQLQPARLGKSAPTWLLQHAEGGDDAWMSALVCGTLRTFLGDFFSGLSGTNRMFLLRSFVVRLLMVSLLWLRGSAQTPRMNPCPSARPGEGEQEENR